MFASIRSWARRLQRDGHAVYLASQDPRTPWHARFVAIAVAAYALSPIDLIPDFIPVIGYLDDLIIVPLGIWLAISLIPADVMAEHRLRADEAAQRPSSRAGMLAIMLIWFVGASLLGWLGYRYWIGAQPVERFNSTTGRAH